MKTIASLEVGQTGEILDQLKKQAIPAEIRTVTQESGLDMSEIMVEDSYFDRGCDVVEAWHAEQLAEQKKRSGKYCRKCGSRNFHRTWDERLGDITGAMSVEPILSGKGRLPNKNARQAARPAHGSGMRDDVSRRAAYLAGWTKRLRRAE